MTFLLFKTADHHNKFDTTEVDIFFLGVFFVCAFLAYYIKRLIKKESEDV